MGPGSSVSVLYVIRAIAGLWVGAGGAAVCFAEAWKRLCIALPADVTVLILVNYVKPSGQGRDVIRR